MAFTAAATVTLCSYQNASLFWVMLWLFSASADHGMIRPDAAHVRRISRWQACWYDVIRIMKLGPYGKTKVRRFTGHAPAILTRRNCKSRFQFYALASKTSKRRTDVDRHVAGSLVAMG